MASRGDGVAPRRAKGKKQIKRRVFGDEGRPQQDEPIFTRKGKERFKKDISEPTQSKVVDVESKRSKLASIFSFSRERHAVHLEPDREDGLFFCRGGIRQQSKASAAREKNYRRVRLSAVSGKFNLEPYFVDFTGASIDFMRDPKLPRVGITGPRPIASGGFGSVWKTNTASTCVKVVYFREDRSGQIVGKRGATSAVKEQIMHSARCEKRFLDKLQNAESKALFKTINRLSYYPIVQAFGYAEQVFYTGQAGMKRFAFIHMQRLGSSLESGLFTPLQTFQIAYAILSAYQYLHGFHIVYNDLKPSNICLGLGDEPRVYLIDLGGAMYLNPNVDDAQKCYGALTLLFAGRDFQYSYFREHEIYRKNVAQIKHINYLTFRGDFENLFYTMLALLVDRLPWSDLEFKLLLNSISFSNQEAAQVLEAKEHFAESFPQSLDKFWHDSMNRYAYKIKMPEVSFNLKKRCPPELTFFYELVRTMNREVDSTAELYNPFFEICEEVFRKCGLTGHDNIDVGDFHGSKYIKASMESGVMFVSKDQIIRSDPTLQ